MSGILESRARNDASTPDARVIRNALQLKRARESWYFVGAVIGFLALVRIVRFLWLKASPPSSEEEEPTSPVSPGDEKVLEQAAPRAKVQSLPVRLSSAVATAFRIVFFRISVPVLPGYLASISELSFTFIYFAVMIILLFTETRDLWTVMYQDRAAHIASVQLPLVVALAGKNNVISWLTGVGHEKLNVLHRASARLFLVFSWLHAMTRTYVGLPAHFSIEHNWMRAGALALTAFTLATMLSVRPIRTRFFEFFLVTHIVLIFIFLVSLIFHTRELDRETYVWPAVFVWGLDRVLRLGRLLWNNAVWRSKPLDDALVELVSEDTIRLTMQKKVTWSPGQHAYVILPSVSKLPFEAHPFTIASIPEKEKEVQDVVFLIRGRNGFTKRLREHAAANSESRVPAYLDGPYGCPPDLTQYSTCILVAGGSGISYTLPLLLDIVRANVAGKASSVRRVVFVWAVRDGVHLSWISKTLMAALNEAKSNIIIEPRIYITGKNFPVLETLALPSGASNFSDSEKKNDIEELELPMYSVLKTVHGRPSVKKLLHEEISIASGPVSVDVAGPSSLAESIRKALTTEIASPSAVLKGSQPVTLHVETFGMVKK